MKSILTFAHRTFEALIILQSGCEPPIEEEHVYLYLPHH